MAIESPSSVVQEIISNDIRVGKHLIGACRAATGYCIGRIDQGLKKVLDSAPAARVTGFYAKTVGRVSDGADKIVDQIGDRTCGAVEKITSGVSGIDNKYAARYLELVSRVSLPALKAARDVAGWVADRTESVALPRPAKRRPARKAKRAIRKAARRARAA